ncbi:hypothetical protein EDF56_101146 [Novosphingobium sp. PhB165]|uniref:DUF2184 domain-containing protein n=1 Tax=Novosphingobium sp. PhB165 TaxID=2485105 RepID=UPI001053F8B1|nr:DUF2184 domain-containing protein [Novosphingobium sp. PhB165]TCM21482.1 hypothetical protein EDF56_101146 [Novosphingobium sp. PhB165]
MQKLLTDSQALTLVTAQAYKVNQTVYETRFPDWDFSRLIYVDTSGPAWSPGILTYTSDLTGRANWQSGYAKDIPLADVSQDITTKTFQLAAIGYQWNIEEVNTAVQVGASLPDRRARAARLAYTKFMFDITLFGSAEKGLGGLTNYPGVVVTIAPADGTGSSTYWVNSAGVGIKTPAQIVRDINIGLQGVSLATFETELADTILLPVEAYNYIAATPYSATTMETILSFVMRTNIYTLTTGRPLTIRTVRELGTAATGGAAGTGRMVVYKNDQDYVKLHLPMPHQFLPVYQDGPLNWTIPGIFRTGGVELLTTVAMRYIDGISQPPA